MCIRDRAISGNNASQIFNAAEAMTGKLLTINQLTLKNGKASGNYGYGGAMGGSLYSGASRLTLNNCVLSRNSAGSGGGAIYKNGGTLTVNNSTLTGNSAGSDGGGIFNTSGDRNGSTVNLSLIHI